MCRHAVSQIVRPTQVTHDRRDRRLSKFPTCFHTHNQERGQHLAQHGCVETITLSLPGANLTDRFAYLPETFNQLLLLPNMPDFCTSHRHLTAMHPRVTTGGALLKEQKHDRATCGTLCTHATRRDVNPPGRIMQNEVLLPLRRLLGCPMHGKGIVAFSCTADFGKPSTMQPCSQRLRHTPGIHGERNFGAINPFKSKGCLPTGYQENEPSCFMRVLTALFGAKQPMERAGNMVEGQDHTTHILATDDVMMSSAQPAPCTLQECTPSSNAPVGKR